MPARSQRDVDLSTPTARARLKPLANRKPRWRFISEGRYLGYRRHLGNPDAGTWCARVYDREAGRYLEATLAAADDRAPADGEKVLGYRQALEHAMAWCDNQERDRRGVAPEERGPYTVARCMADYLDWYSLHREAIKATRYAIDAHVLPALGATQVADLTLARLKRWHQQLASQPVRLRTRRGEAPRHAQRAGDPEQLRKRKATANRVLTILKAALNHAYNDGRGGLTTDATWRKVKPFRGVDAPKVRFLTAEEIRRLQNACELDFRSLVQGALLTGARYGELRGARVRDYLTDSQSLYIPKSKGGKDSYRERLTPPLRPPAPSAGGASPVWPNPAARQPQPEAGSELVGEIKSADSNAITSVGLREFRELVAAAHAESARLRGEQPAIAAQAAAASAKAEKWERGVLLRRLLRKRFEGIQEDAGTAQRELLELEREIERCRIALEIELEAGMESSYGALVDAFRVLAACDRCWDTTSERSVDQRAERSSATSAITRREVRPVCEGSALLMSSRSAMKLPNANGGDLFIYPGMLLVFRSDRDFGLINVAEVRLSYKRQQFIESEGVPGDTQVIGQTWEKVNKDGRPDRRFADNRQLPIVEYGSLSFESAAGLREEYLFSNAAKAERFKTTFSAHQATLPL